MRNVPLHHIYRLFSACKFHTFINQIIARLSLSLPQPFLEKCSVSFFFSIEGCSHPAWAPLGCAAAPFLLKDLTMCATQHSRLDDGGKIAMRKMLLRRPPPRRRRKIKSHHVCVVCVCGFPDRRWK